ncbi:branched-chain amino acid ABC transporter permease [Amycolatopsis acidicola]|uniref:Branched-chain amino acid ABC transporter permease n=1 Tax=Amycolatopsis acidicola TaxID=2596893 RepID=A0A5N0VIH5_9PSEU|nr:branched-chain amino acid ABC transporter permease [Amycolatopsis acidicola]KAA9164482.1 branched-chain amino acid ABC transporter permease [Amycolatopsis acidicola]
MNATTLSVAEPDLGLGMRKTGLHGKLLARGGALAVIAAVAGLAVPYVVPDRYTMGLLLDGIILAMLALGIGFLARHLGLISLGHTAFFGGAAYALAIANQQWGWGPVPAAVFGLAVGTALALLMGLLVVRASGMGFLMLTLALGQALYQFCVQTVARPWTGAYDGLQVQFGPGQTFFGMPVASVMNAALFWPVVWVVLVVAAFALWLLGRARFGQVLEGIRENEERMRFSGYGTFRPRLTAFVVSGAVAALGGVLFALNAAYVSPDVLSFVKAGDSLIAAIVGGLGSLAGPVVGALAYIWAQAQFNTSGNLQLYTGIALVLVLVFLPGGITGGLAKLAVRIKRRARR